MTYTLEASEEGTLVLEGEEIVATIVGSTPEFLIFIAGETAARALLAAIEVLP
jgi:hypothetical protein